MPSPDIRKMAEAVARRVDRLALDRAPWEVLWREVAEYCLPDRVDHLSPQSRGPGQAGRGGRAVDATAQHGLRMLAASLNGLLTNPAEAWFALSTGDAELDGVDPVQEWLEAARDRALAVINDPAANFYPQAHELYLDLACFGSAVMHMEDTAQGLRFSTRPLAECALGEGAEGRVDTLARRFSLTARQALELFGERAGPVARRAAGTPSRLDDPIEHLHLVAPLCDLDPAWAAEAAASWGGGGGGGGVPFAAVYLEGESRWLCDLAVTPERPFLAPRWEKRSGDVYGRSPAMAALPDVKTLNAIVRTTLKAAQKAVDPPMTVPEDGVSGPIDLSPGAVNFVRAGGALRPIELGGRPDLGVELISLYRASIRAALLTDVLFLGESPQMTATEVLKRDEERLRALGPLLGRMQSEFLGPLADRVLGALDRRGWLPPRPPQLSGRRLTVRFLSPVARAHRLSEANGALRTLEAVGRMAAFEQNVIDTVDFDLAPRLIGDAFGAPARLFRPQAELAAARRARTGAGAS